MFDIPGSDIVGVRVDEEAVKTKSAEYIRSRSSNDESVKNERETDYKTVNNDDSKISVPTC